LGLTFFGQKYDFFKISTEIINESYRQLFLMTYYMGWNFFDAYSLPIKLRNWFFEEWIERRKNDLDIINKER